MVFPRKDAEKGFQSLCGLQSQTKCLGGTLLTAESWEFPGGPVVRTLGQRTKILQASQPKPKEKLKKKRNLQKPFTRPFKSKDGELEDTREDSIG